MATATSIMHAVSVNVSGRTLCGKWVANLSGGESYVIQDMPGSVTITCHECQVQSRDRTLSVEDYEPRSTLTVPEHLPERARYPFIDVHSHQTSIGSQQLVDELVNDMDLLNLRVMVNLSGGYGSTLSGRIASLEGRHPSRFVTFANIDFSQVDASDYSQRAASQLEEDVKNGARGLKIFKNLGMDLLDNRSQRIHVDDT